MAALGLCRKMWRAADRAVESFSEGSSRRLSMNDPSTALVGFGEGCGRPFGRLSMNDPPTALVGFRSGSSATLLCRLSMNDPPTALVGFRKASRRAVGHELHTTGKSAAHPFLPDACPPRTCAI